MGLSDGSNVEASCWIESVGGMEGSVATADGKETAWSSSGCGEGVVSSDADGTSVTVDGREAAWFSGWRKAVASPSG